MASSTIPACQVAVLQILRARPALANVTIDWPPTKDEDFAGEMIFLTDVVGDEDWGAIGAYSRKEAYRLGLTVWCEQWGDSPAAAVTRVHELWKEVANGLRDDLTAGTPRGSQSLLRAAGIDQYDQVTYRQFPPGPASPEKSGARIDATVGFSARIVTT